MHRRPAGEVRLPAFAAGAPSGWMLWFQANQTAILSGRLVTTGCNRPGRVAGPISTLFASEISRLAGAHFTSLAQPTARSKVG